ncbi:MAG: hypothetical protein J2P50_07065 [Hyphomicrobiaceae bacterium]|nr:hypothetical protein [Hyphomicrobiaceae bacterium]
MSLQHAPQSRLRLTRLRRTRLRRTRLRLIEDALGPSAMAVRLTIGSALGFALGLSGCAKPLELAPGVAGAKIAPWQAQLTLSPAAERPLSDGEGEFVVAAAIAAQEKRRP